MKKWAILAGFLSAFAQPAHAETSTALDLQRSCMEVERFNTTGVKPPTDEGIAAFSECLSYLRGFVDGTTTAKMNQVAFCAPLSAIRPVEEQQVLLKYLRDHPNELHEPSALVVLRALAVAFPCPKK